MDNGLPVFCADFRNAGGAQGDYVLPAVFLIHSQRFRIFGCLQHPERPVILFRGQAEDLPVGNIHGFNLLRNDVVLSEDPQFAQNSGQGDILCSADLQGVHLVLVTEFYGIGDDIGAEAVRVKGKSRDVPAVFRPGEFRFNADRNPVHHMVQGQSAAAYLYVFFPIQHVDRTVQRNIHMVQGIFRQDVLVCGSNVQSYIFSSGQSRRGCPEALDLHGLFGGHFRFLRCDQRRGSGHIQVVGNNHILCSKENFFRFLSLFRGFLRLLLLFRFCLLFLCFRFCFFFRLFFGFFCFLFSCFCQLFFRFFLFLSFRLFCLLFRRFLFRFCCLFLFFRLFGRLFILEIRLLVLNLVFLFRYLFPRGFSFRFASFFCRFTLFRNCFFRRNSFLGLLRLFFFRFRFFLLFRRGFILFFRLYLYLSGLFRLFICLCVDILLLIRSSGCFLFCGLLRGSRLFCRSRLLCGSRFFRGHGLFRRSRFCRRSRLFCRSRFLCGSRFFRGHGFFRRRGFFCRSRFLCGSGFFRRSRFFRRRGLLHGSRFFRGRRFFHRSGLFHRSRLFYRCRLLHGSGLFYRCGLLCGSRLFNGSRLLHRHGFFCRSRFCRRSGLLCRRSYFCRSRLINGSNFFRRNGLFRRSRLFLLHNEAEISSLPGIQCSKDQQIGRCGRLPRSPDIPFSGFRLKGFYRACELIGYFYLNADSF